MGKPEITKEVLPGTTHPALNEAKPIPAAVRTSLEQLHSARMELRKSLSDTNSPAESAADRQVSEGTVDKPEPAKFPNPEKDTGILTSAQVRKMGTAELIQNTFAALGRMLNMFKGGVNLGSAEKYSDTEIQKMRLEIERGMDTVYAGPERSVDYVAAVWGIPAKENPQKMLDGLKASGLPFNTDKNQLSTAKVGDLIFFKGSNGSAKQIVVISKTEPLTVKMIPGSGGKPEDVEIRKSDYFRNDYLGFISMKKPATTFPKGASTEKSGERNA